MEDYQNVLLIVAIMIFMIKIKTRSLEFSIRSDTIVNKAKTKLSGKSFNKVDLKPLEMNDLSYHKGSIWMNVIGASRYLQFELRVNKLLDKF